MMRGWMRLLVGSSTCLFGAALLHGAVASPGDVRGSLNIAVDTYQNSAGSFILFADGRIQAARSAEHQDLGHPYQEPPGSAEIRAAASAQRGSTQGSPNVAIKALVRSDATYVLFANGTLRKPNHSDAAKGAASGAFRTYLYSSLFQYNYHNGFNSHDAGDFVPVDGFQNPRLSLVVQPRSLAVSGGPGNPGTGEFQVAVKNYTESDKRSIGGHSYVPVSFSVSGVNALNNNSSDALIIVSENPES